MLRIKGVFLIYYYPRSDLNVEITEEKSIASV